MSIINLQVYTQIAKADTSPSPNSIVLRDGGGNTQLGSLTVASVANNGAQIDAPTGITASTPLTGTSGRIETFNQTSAALTATLPPVNSAEGQLFTFIKADATTFAPVMKQSGSDPIITTGGVSQTTGYVGSNTQGKQYTLYSDGTTWWA